MNRETAYPVEVAGLVAHWGPHRILDGIDLRVRRGEILVIMGGSGSGKTTLLRHMLGLKRPTAGTVQVFGQDIHQLGSRALHDMRALMGMSFQGGALFNSLSVGENIAMPLREHARLDECTIRILVRLKLEMVRLGGCEQMMPAELSGGMLKRAALARAIALDPPLLFFDEPSAGLDPIVAAELDALILELRDAMDVTIVVVTHELESAFKIADRIAVLDQGKILNVDTVGNIRDSQNVRVRSFLGGTPVEEHFDADAYLSRLTAGIR